MAKEKLFFIALLPPEDISAKVTAFKMDIAARYHSKSALRVMPHITLKAPFKVSAEDHEKVIHWFRNLSLRMQPFTVHIDGFGAFHNKHNPVIYVHPQMSGELAQLQSGIIHQFENAFPQIRLSTNEYQFSPHMTIAYRDLSFENFEKAWSDYKDKQYHASFAIDKVCLLQHNGTKWEVIEEVKLNS